ncbi:SDR family oxidoreductase [Subtercola frigoramans]|uniref:NAD(P)-dependent dehydrogenase (Short-subunit alcohol dehydrogenase family) n=1 Tax=Subtercola frigoramans TaxID=120298 RepID=A0ABS2L8M4_9MICO|nr:SDR family oxidoreductase [Subtercola frigoramans]MBM7472801.1 NAD(P)-dependent dehydrogenase (short-subunit alcohol dehydrogenase family) [Subtercola frigoramans]
MIGKPSRRPFDIVLPELTGKRALVTGANSGLGFETAKRLMAAGADVIITARSAEKGQAALRELQSLASVASPQPARGTVTLASLDLATLASVERLASEVVADGHPLDLLFNNAGVMAVPKRTLTDDGFELQLGTNHLGHFALTGSLLPALMRSDSARVITMSSIMHWMGRIDFDDLQSENHYNAWGAYGQSKLANLMFAKEFARRSASLGWKILSVAAHPGFSRTNLQSSGPNLGREKPSGFMSRMNAAPGMTQSAAEGALPELFAATNPEALGGDYFGPSGFFELTGEPGFAHFAKRADKERPAELLWSMSESLTGVTFPTD